MRIRKQITLWQIENPKVYVKFSRKITEEFLMELVKKYESKTRISNLIGRKKFSEHFQEYLKNKLFIQLRMVKQLLNLLPSKKRSCN